MFDTRLPPQEGVKFVHFREVYNYFALQFQRLRDNILVTHRTTTGHNFLNILTIEVNMACCGLPSQTGTMLGSRGVVYPVYLPYFQNFALDSVKVTLHKHST